MCENNRDIINKQYKILSPKNDIVFQMLFSTENTKITKELISSIIEMKINTIELDRNKQLERKEVDDKIGIVDLRAKINNNIECEIEMHMIYSKNFISRLLYYCSKLYSNQLKRGKNYEDLNRTISIAIINDYIPELKDLPSHTKWQIKKSRLYRKILTDKLEIHIIEISKAIKEYEKNKFDKRLQWMMFFDNPESMEVGKIMENNKDIKEAKDILNSISRDEKNQRIAELRLKNILDKNDIYLTAREQGLEEGKKEGLKKGKEEGLKEGKKEGRKEGIKEGIKEGNKEGIKKGIDKQRKNTIKEMLKEKESIEKIIKYTGATEKEIIEIKKSM